MTETANGERRMANSKQAKQLERQLGSCEARKPEDFLASKPSSLPAHAGFTIVELLVSILLTFIIMGAIYSVYRVQTRSIKAQESRLEAQEYARSVLDMMVREIRNAGYNPVSASSTTCTGSLVPGSPGVITAAEASFRFTYDYRGANSTDPPDGDCNDADEEITYTFDPADCTAGLGNITRNGSSNPLTDCNVTSLDLRYFKQDGTELVRPVAAVDLPDIQRVLISVTVQSKNPDAEFGGQLTVTMTSNANLRNRGLPA